MWPNSVLFSYGSWLFITVRSSCTKSSLARSWLLLITSVKSCFPYWSFFHGVSNKELLNPYVPINTYKKQNRHKQISCLCVTLNKKNLTFSQQLFWATTSDSFNRRKQNTQEHHYFTFTKIGWICDFLHLLTQHPLWCEISKTSLPTSQQ